MHDCTCIQVEFTLVDSDMCKPPLKWAQGLINKTFSVQRSVLSGSLLILVSRCFECHPASESMSSMELEALTHALRSVAPRDESLMTT